ncbi:MAG: hypothetical protein ABIN39_05420 [candidate division WOR-3 bacterium]
MLKNKIKLVLKSLFVQVLLNEDEMQLSGYKILTNGKFNHHINSNPYFATIVSGFISKVDDLKKIEIFASISAFIGDDLFWNNLKPITLMVSLFVYIFKIETYFLLIPFLIYFFSTNTLRFIGYEYGAKNSETLGNFYSSFFFKNFRFFLSKVKYLLFGFFTIFLLYLNLKILNLVNLYVIIFLLCIWVNILFKEFAYIFLFILGVLLEVLFKVLL